MNEFEKLGLGRELLKAIEAEGIEKPSEIQEKSIPLLLQGRDLIGGSATGSGKTLAFTSPIIENLRPNKNVQALILTPTRELAEQVSDSIKKFSKNKKLNVLAIYGGVNIEPQIRKLAIADVVVGTPGRILDHLQKRTLNLDYVKFLVLDEVDRMFDMGFHFDVEKIIRECPTERQTMMFSATISGELDHLAQKYTKNPVEVSVKSYVDPSQLKQIFYDVGDNQRFSLLIHLLRKEKSELIMVFCSTRRNADFVADNLANIGINAKAIHGGLDQKKRSHILKEFLGKGVGVLVCTDVAARGLDIPGVSHVYNYDIPKTSNDYIHRIGRTARAGKEGIAINLLSSRDYENFSNVKRDGSLNIVQQELPRFEMIRYRTDLGSDRNSGARGRNFGGREDRSGREFGRNTSGGRSPGGHRRENQGGRNFGGGRSFGGNSRSFGNKRDDGKPRNFSGQRDIKSFGHREDKPRNSGRSYGSKDKKSSKRFDSKNPQRFNRKRPNTRRPTGNRNFSRR